jgi:putative DNA primase/helicase
VPPDANDILRANGSAELRRRLDQGTSEPAPEGEAPPRPTILPEFMAMQFPPLEMVLSPIIPVKGIVMIYARRGIGKTHVALGCSYAAATGGRFLHWQSPRPHRVLHIDGEMQAAALQERWRWTMNGGPCPANLEMLSSDAAGISFNLSALETQTWVDGLLDGVELMVLDNLSSLTNAAENDAEGWATIQDWLLRLRRRGVAVLMIHHAGKGGEQRGTSRREDVLDTSIALLHPADYRPEQGARFEVHYKKSRRALGEDVKPFEAQLTTNGLEACWTMSDLEDVEDRRIAELSQNGLSVRDIAAETGLSKSQIHRIQKRIQEKEDQERNSRLWGNQAAPVE